VPIKQRFPKERIPQFSTEVLELFRDLDATPKRARRSPQFRAGDRKLAEMLGLETQWWGGVGVIDCGARNRFQPWLASHLYWGTCKEIREQLLLATRVPLRNGSGQS
jgi:hypothetical protein